MYREQHVMQLVRTHPSGAEEWYCPTCGRSFWMQWPPNYSRSDPAPENEAAARDPRLQPWADWLAAVDLETRLDA